MRHPRQHRDVEGRDIAGDIVALHHPGNGQPVGDAFFLGMLFQRSARGTIAHHQDMQVETLFVQRREIDQPVHGIPAAHKARESQHQALRQSQRSLRPGAVRHRAETFRIDAIGDHRDARRRHAIFRHHARQHAGDRQHVIDPVPQHALCPAPQCGAGAGRHSSPAPRTAARSLPAAAAGPWRGAATGRQTGTG